MPEDPANPADHIAFTLHNALDWYSCGWTRWKQLEEELRQASAYYHWLYGSSASDAHPSLFE